jgi:glutamyl-tRNA synthetase
VLARRCGGSFVLRIEDIDRPRVVPGARRRIEEDLRWLGLSWDETPLVQSERDARYEQALSTLAASGRVYPCDCSRAEVARVASAPHAGEDVVYPGICRTRDPARSMKRAPALRVALPAEVVAYEDTVAGVVSQRLDREVGDFVLRRGDGVFSYQLAVVVDDAAMRITDVVRGADLLSSTPRQLWLAGALGVTPPRYAHVPLVVGSDGARLEKRMPAGFVRRLREAGVAAERVVGELAHGLGLAAKNAPATPDDIVRACIDRPIAWRTQAWPIPASLASAAG